MIFLWSPRNRAHVGKHAVECVEAEHVVRNARRPYPARAGEDKHVVWGQAEAGRFLQVIFVYVSLDDVEPDEYEQLKLHERMEIEGGAEAVRVIHARELTENEKRQPRKRK